MANRFETFEGHRPRVDKPSYVAATARLIGHVSLGERCSVWPGVVIRADHEPITIGRLVNIQDNAVVHADPDLPVRIGDSVTIGHGAVVHACTVGNDVLIGIGAIILNGAVIGDGAVVGAGAVVPEGKVIEPRTLVLGVPAKPVRTVDEAFVEDQRRHAENYWRLAQRHLAGRPEDPEGTE